MFKKNKDWSNKSTKEKHYRKSLFVFTVGTSSEKSEVAKNTLDLTKESRFYHLLAL